ncbi:hypothetical protein MKX01_022139 [Papaver californicum]|nr:hypothetical protein MKX01_022139 [Papaver californicum]
MVKAAFDSIDLELHSGTHPRLGVVDHICFHPFAQTSQDETAWLEKSVAADIGSSRQDRVIILAHFLAKVGRAFKNFMLNRKSTLFLDPPRICSI